MESSGSFLVAALTICLGVVVGLAINKVEGFFERRRERKRGRKWM